MWIDELLFSKADRDFACEVWVPQKPIVVLGNSNQADLECDINHCEYLSIPILKRAGGGGTVVLHDGCVVVSIGAWMKSSFRNDVYFESINQVIALILSSAFNLPPILQRGISDLAISEKKIAGTSLFRSKGYLLYQASILIESKIDLIETCLLHPTKEPEYRQGKPHRAFIAGLNEFKPELTTQEVVDSLRDNLQTNLKAALKEELVSVDSNHLKWILRRANSQPIGFETRQ